MGRDDVRRDDVKSKASTMRLDKAEFTKFEHIYTLAAGEGSAFVERGSSI